MRIQDWVLELGFDNEKVKKGMKKTDRLMEKSLRLEQKRTTLQKVRLGMLAKELSLTERINKSKPRVVTSRAVTPSITRGVQRPTAKDKAAVGTKEETALISTKTRLTRTLAKAELLGVKHSKEKNMLSSSNVDNIRRTIALLGRRIAIRERELGIQKKQTEEARKASLVKAKASPAPLGQRAPTAAQRDSVGTSAGRGAIGAASLVQLAPLSDAANSLRRIKKELLDIETGSSTAKTQDELRKLGKRAGDLKFEMQGLAKAQRASSKEMTKSQFAAHGLRQSLGNLARSYVSVFAVLAAGAALFRTAKDFERIRATMLLSSDGAEDAGINFKYVADMSERLGSDISATADAFVGFNVSAISAGLTAAKSKAIFEELAVSIQATGLDAHRSGLAFLAFKQMLAGPVIQAQEMNQVNEQMPQFTGVARKALKELGYEGENFKDIIATGTVESHKFVAVVSRMLNEQAVASGAAAKSQNNLIAAQNRMNNSLKALADTIATSGINEALADIFTVIKDAVRIITPALKMLALAFKVLASALSAPLKAITALMDAFGILDTVIFALIANFLRLGLGTRIANSALVMYIRSALIGAAGAGVLSKAMAVLKGSIYGVKLALTALLSTGPLLLMVIGFELLGWLIEVVKTTDLWKSSVDSVTKSIQNGVRNISIMLLYIKRLIAYLRIYSRMVESGFSYKDAGRLIDRSESVGKSAGMKEVARRKQAAAEANNVSNASTTTNNNNVTLAINGGDQNEVRKTVEQVLQNQYLGA